MKTFTYGKGVSVGILAEGGQVMVGEPGRGRVLVQVPLPPGSVIEGDRLLEVPGDECSLVVLVEDQSGFRGTWRARAARTANEKAVIETSRNAHEAARRTGKGAFEARRTAQGEAAPGYETYDFSPEAGAAGPGCGHSEIDAGPKCPGCATAWPKERPPSWKVIAQGERAQGTAGRMGGGPVYLAKMLKGESVELVRGGRLYGAPRVIRLENRDGELVTVDVEAEAATAAAAAAW